MEVSTKSLFASIYIWGAAVIVFVFIFFFFTLLIIADTISIALDSSDLVNAFHVLFKYRTF